MVLEAFGKTAEAQEDKTAVGQRLVVRGSERERSFTVDDGLLMSDAAEMLVHVGDVEAKRE